MCDWLEAKKEGEMPQVRLCHQALMHINSSALTAILPVIQVFPGVHWSMRREQTENCIGA